MPVAVSGSTLDSSSHQNQLYRLLHYVANNFSHFSTLALVRLKYFFLNTRDYYSNLHNVYLLVNLFLFYGCIILGIKRITKTFSKSLLVFVFSTIFFFAMAVAFQCDDYHNRFFMTLMPLLAVLAIASILPFLVKMVNFFLKPGKG
jgi:hypothetical protein